MALANYTDLLSAINGAAGWLHRADLGSIAPDWITLAEVTMNDGDLETLNVPALRTGDQETIYTYNCVPKVQTLALPSNFLEMRKVYITYGGSRLELQQAPVLPIRYDELSNVASVPRSYIVVGSSLYLIPIPDQAYPVTLDYYAKIGPLTASSSTNWLMTAAPNCYLSGAIVHGAPWLGPKFDPNPWIAAFRTSMRQVQRSDLLKRTHLTQMRSDASQLQRSPFNIMVGN